MLNGGRGFSVFSIGVVITHVGFVTRNLSVVCWLGNLRNVQSDRWGVVITSILTNPISVSYCFGKREREKTLFLLLCWHGLLRFRRRQSQSYLINYCKICRVK
jgi:hypothetical protein